MGVIEFFQSLLPGRNTAPSAPGNTSDTTIAAATTEARAEQQAAQTPSRAPQVAPAGSRKQQQIEREYSRQQSGSSQTSTPAPSSSSSSPRNVLQEIANQNKPAQTVTEAMRESNTQPEPSPGPSPATVEVSESLSNIVTNRETARAAEELRAEESKAQEIEVQQTSKLEQQLSQFEYVTKSNIDPRLLYQIEQSQSITQTPGLRERAMEYQKEATVNAVNTAGDILFGNTVTFIETQFTNPDGTLNFEDAIWEQLDKWDAAEGTGDYRAQRSIGAAVDIGGLFLGGGIGGVAVKGGSVALSKLGTTAAGSAVVRVVTSPIVNPKVLDTAADALSKIKIPLGETAVNTGKTVISATTTPTAATANALTVAYGADVLRRANEASTDPEGKVAAGLAIAAKEILTGGLGAREGYKAATRVEDYFSTKKLEYIPRSEISVRGIPLGYTSEKSLTAAFKENTLIPAPYVEYSQIGAVPPGLIRYPQSAKINPQTNEFIEAWHATPYGDKFGQKFVVSPSTSEYDGLYAAPVLEEHFAKTSINPKMSLFISKFGPDTTNQPAAINLRIPGVKTIDWQQLADEAGEPLERVVSSTRLSERLANRFLETKAEKGYAYLPLTKDEYEGVIPVGSEFTQLPTRYYTRAGPNLRRIPIKEYEFSGMGKQTADDIPDINAPRKRSGSSYSRDNREPLPAFATLPRGYSARQPSTVRVSNPKISSVKVPAVKVSRPLSEQGTGYTVPQTTPSRPPSKVTNPEQYRPGGYSSVKASAPKISSVTYNPPRRPSPLNLEFKKKDDDLKKELKQYTAARTGRIDHLSIIDPAEMLGRGTLTDRSRPDRVLRKQEIYFVDGNFTTKKPRGRVRT